MAQEAMRNPESQILQSISDDAGIIADLFQASVDLLRIAFSSENPVQLSDAQKRKLKRTSQSLILWGESHKTAAGALDIALQESPRLLKLVVNVFCALIRRIAFDLYQSRFPDQQHTASQLLERARFAKTQDDDDDNSAKSDEDEETCKTESERHSVDETLSRLAADVDRLNDLNESLTTPVLGLTDSSGPSIIFDNQKVPIHHSFSNLIRESFPHAAESVVDHLGKSNFIRFRRLLELRSTAHDIIQPTDVVGETDSKVQSSRFKDSGYGGSENASAAAPSVASSAVSSVSDKLRSKYPPLPQQARSGALFECVACGHDISVRTTNKYRRHIIQDLNPYSCLYGTCSAASVPFDSRVSWRDHILLEHARENEPLWETNGCPLCLTPMSSVITSDGKYVLLTHIASHLEEISLSVIPQDPDSDESSGSEGSVTERDDTLQEPEAAIPYEKIAVGEEHLLNVLPISDKQMVTPANLGAFLEPGYARALSHVGWQAQLSAKECADRTCKMVTHLRLERPDMTFGAAVKISMQREAQARRTCQSIAAYRHLLQTQIPYPSMIVSDLRETHKSPQIPQLSTQHIGVQASSGQPPRAGTSSYWSVQEQNTFQAYVSYYGTDFQQISSLMGTKTNIMVKNFFEHKKLEGSMPEVIQAAMDADEKRKRGEPLGPPPSPFAMRKSGAHARPSYEMEPSSSTTAGGSQQQADGPLHPSSSHVELTSSSTATQSPTKSIVVDSPSISSNHRVGAEDANLGATANSPSATASMGEDASMPPPDGTRLAHSANKFARAILSPVADLDASSSADGGTNAAGPSGQSTESSRPQKHPATFQCTLCPKRFTRALNLRSHLRTHQDERPFVCIICAKAYARQNDLERHEALHTEQERSLCHGYLRTGDRWGCGEQFASPVALGHHFRSEAGQVCVRPLLDEEAIKKPGAN